MKFPDLCPQVAFCGSGKIMINLILAFGKIVSAQKSLHPFGPELSSLAAIVIDFFQSRFPD